MGIASSLSTNRGESIMLQAIVNIAAEPVAEEQENVSSTSPTPLARSLTRYWFYLAILAVFCSEGSCLPSGRQ